MTLQTSRNTNKRVISTFNFGYPHLTLKEGPKVKSDDIKRFLAARCYPVDTLIKNWFLNNEQNILKIASLSRQELQSAGTI